MRPTTKGEYTIFTLQFVSRFEGITISTGLREPRCLPMTLMFS
ncbi:MAG TPA: hypothetical protein VIQ24_11790 [Pyrinomonadaceae bacterium]